MFVDVDFKDGYQCRFKHLYTCDWHYYYESETAYYIVPCKDVLISRVSVEESLRCNQEAKAASRMEGKEVITSSPTITNRNKEETKWQEIVLTSNSESE